MAPCGARVALPGWPRTGAGRRSASIGDGAAAAPAGLHRVRVTARIVSKKKTEDVKEVTVFKRYSDFKKLHGELSYIHRNLFRKSEEFPAFPKAQVFGRFDEPVIEERRRCAEEMLRFTVDIPALYNSPQLKDFFKDGEVVRPLELAAPQDGSILPAPLIPLPSGDGNAPGSWPGLLPAPLEPSGRAEPPPWGELEMDRGEVADAPPQTPPRPTHGAQDELDAGQKEVDETCSPFDSGTEEENDEHRLQTRSPLSENELALFDPCAKEEPPPDPSHESNLQALTVSQSGLLLAEEQGHPPEDLERRLSHLRMSPEDETPAGPAAEGLTGADYLSTAAECIKEALEHEVTQEYALAFDCYRNGVDILLKGVQGELSAERRDAVKKKTAEYLKHAEAIFTLHLKDSAVTDGTPSS
ncbi:sorting nexin-15 [Heptranchias perlo]|uniref:sorting nexin-15 n=1 Tax=Heptranchias perlo TaxID=212740 RepID=UPI0035596837